MATLFEKKLVIVRNELDWLIDNSGEVQSVAEFFAGGGFDNWSEDDINRLYKDLTEA